MPDSASTRLPARPSLEQLRKLSKDLLRAWRDGDAGALQRVRSQKPDVTEPMLADAQFVVAREHGFDSWPKLVHHLTASDPKALDVFNEIARDFAAAYHGDIDALGRLNTKFSDTKSVEALRYTVHRRQGRPESERGMLHPFALPDAQLFVAQLMGFANWDALTASTRIPAADPHTVPHGMSARPPFYRIDWSTRTLEPRQPLTDQDWDTLIDVIREHGITGVNANQQMTDRALERLARVGHVTKLALGGSRQLTDDGLHHLARMPQLEELDISEYPGGRLTDRGLEVLRHLSELRKFQMCWQGGISDAGVANLSSCEKLERVDLLGSPTGDGAIRALRGKPNLRVFKTGKLVTDAGLPLLHDFPVFKSWRGGEMKYGLMTFDDAEPNHLMVDGPFSNAGIAGLSGLEGVFSLSFFWHVSALTPDGLQSLAHLPNLGVLGCQGQLCNGTAMRHIASIPRLRMLMAQGTVATDDGFAALSRSQTIEYIWGRECPNLQGRGFRALAGMPALKGLAVSCKSVDDASLAALPLFPSLRWLLPMDVTDNGFRHVGQCAQLEKLTCMYCRDTGDLATEHIVGLSGLKEYYAGQTLITDRSLEILGGLLSLETIALSACAGISDAGLVHLARLPRLSKLSVDASARVTRAGIAIFPPHVRVDFWT